MAIDPKEYNRSVEAAQKDIVKISGVIKDLSATHQELQGRIKELDDSLIKNENGWQDSQKRIRQNITQQLKDQEIILNEAEIARLDYDDSTVSTVNAAREELAKAGIKIPSNASDMTVVTCAAVNAESSRTMQKREVYNIVKSLKAIKEEQGTTDEFKKGYKKQIDQMTHWADELKNKIRNTKGLSEAEKENFEKIIQFTQKTVIEATTEKKPQEELTLE